MNYKKAILLFYFNYALVSCMTSAGRSGHGLIGYGITMYKPLCAFSCRASISSSTLNCTNMEDMGGMDGMGMDMASGETRPDCYATDDAFLQTLAWCIHTHCTDVPPWKLERYWQMNVAGIAAVQPDPKETYQEALAKIKILPSETLVSGDPLNQTRLVSEDDYLANWNGQAAFESQEQTHERYGLVLLLSGSVVPVGFSLLRFIPWPAHLTTKFNAFVLYPPVFGTRHNEAILGLAHIPTRGQSFFIFYLITINVVLSATGYKSLQPNSWWPNDASAEILVYVTNRLGVLSFANVPLLILYAGRNNVLLYLTNWSHGTFLVLHRWVSFICTMEAVLHSAIYLQIYVAEHTHSSESKLPYWFWGVIATLAMSLLLPTSLHPLRRKLYEVFLLWHIALSILVIVGCYLHIIYRFEHQWGYEVWIFVAMAVWVFDRVMRVGRMARNGLRNALVTIIDEDYVRLDVEGVVGAGHAYLYFPTLTWRVWENHPFSIASAVVAPIADKKDHHNGEPKSPSSNTSDLDVEKIQLAMHKPHSPSFSKTINPSKSDRSDSPNLSSNSPVVTKLGMQFFIRTHTGLTSRLRSQTSIPILIESVYGAPTDLSPYSKLICIAGGVGITAVLPYLRSFPGSKRLFWGVRRGTCIAGEMEKLVEGIEKEIFSEGRRMDVREVLRREVSVSGKERLVVVVSGPAGMADEVRMAVVGIGKEKGVVIGLVEENFSW